MKVESGRKMSESGRKLGRPRKAAPPFPPGSEVEQSASVSEFAPITQKKVMEQIEELVASCQHDPLKYVLLAFPWNTGQLEKFSGPDMWQVDLLKRVGAGTLTTNEAIRIATTSGHGIGKSALVSWIVLWAMSTKADTRGVVTANTEVQLKTKTWAELSKWYHLCINKDWFTMSATALYSADPTHERLWRIDQVPWSAANTEAFAGLHNQGKRILLIFDEASAIDDAIWEVSEGALTDTDTEIMWLVFGNPTKNTGRFRECFGKFSHRWQTIRVDSREAKISNKTQIAEWVEDFGVDSDFVRVRVRGEFPRAGSDQFIPGDAVDECRRYKAIGYEKLPKVMACDVARFGDDMTVIGVRQGRHFEILAKMRGLDNVQVAARLCAMIEEHAPDAVIVDGDGLGAGVVDHVRNRGYHKRGAREILHEFHGGAKLHGASAYYNRRAECWGLMREALRAGMEIPDLAELAEDLERPTYGHHKGTQQIQLESKADMKKRGERSPDLGDTLAMTFAVRLAAKKDVAPQAKQRNALGWML